jgi:hypothetical protein
VKANKPSAKAKILLMPTCKERVTFVAGPEAASEISELPLSADTTRRRIYNLLSDIKVNFRRKNIISGEVSFFIGISGHAQLTANIDISIEI